jgi:CHRD domain
MKRLSIFITVMAGLLTTASVVRGETWGATLTGYEESPPVSTVANGDFRATVQDGDNFHYTLTYSGLQGKVTQGHIHVGQVGVNGSIIIFLCQTSTNEDPTGRSPQCPQSGTVEGRITAANVIAGSMASQQLNAKDFDGALAAIRAGAAYVNVHTSPLSTGGEVRGQIRVVGK